LRNQLPPCSTTVCWNGSLRQKIHQQRRHFIIPTTI
jgi:hypothetical protein